jgi:hypothetical protein
MQERIMRQTQQTTIGTTVYHVTQMGGLAGRRAFNRFMKLAGPLQNLSDEKARNLAFMTGLSDEDMDYFCDTFAALTRVQTADMPGPVELKPIFDLHFAGKYTTMMQWLSFCFQVNFLGEETPEAAGQ